MLALLLFMSLFFGSFLMFLSLSELMDSVARLFGDALFSGAIFLCVDLLVFLGSVSRGV